MKFLPAPRKLIIALLLSIACGAQISLQTSVQAEPAATSLQFKMPQLPSRGRPIGRYRGGASRGTCSAVALPLTALVPFTKQPSRTDGEEVTYVWGLTTFSNPTFWFFTPYENGSTHPAEFVLQDLDGNDVYRTKVVLPNQPGVLGIRLPSNVATLQPDTSYHWYFKVYCGQQKVGAPIFVEGIIQRVALDGTVAKQLKTASPRQKADLYAANGIWYDALTILAELRVAHPQDSRLVSDWQSLLQSVGLESVATAPLAQ